MSIFKAKRTTVPAQTASQTALIQKSLNWEESRAHLLEKSESRAWLITRVLAVMTLLAVVALAVLVPFYKVVPVVFRVDKLTDEIVQVDINNATLPQSEAMDKHWLANYVQTRERYVWTLLHTDFYAVMALSDERVGNEYKSIYEGANALDKKLGAETDIRVILISVELNPGTPGKATVTWERTMRTKGTDVEKNKRFVSSISYTYVPNAALSREAQIIANPFGFKVDGYAIATVLSSGKASTSNAANTTNNATSSTTTLGEKP